jgi:predicted nucleic acid-binding Zn ribbon protein
VSDAGSGGEGSGRSKQSGPRRLGSALERVVAEQAPATLLAEVQTVWPEVCGAAIAARAEPVAEREGRITIACENGAWAQELEMMGDLLRERIDGAIGAGRVSGLRFTADLARHR